LIFDCSRAFQVWVGYVNELWDEASDLRPHLKVQTLVPKGRICG
jgi:hypothetical protein